MLLVSLITTTSSIFIATYWEIFWSYKLSFRQPNQLAVSTNQTIHTVLDFPPLFCQLMLQGGWCSCCFSCHREQEHQTENKGTIKQLSAGVVHHILTNTFPRFSDVSIDRHSSATSVWSAQKLELAHSSCNYSPKNNIHLTSLTERVCPWILLLAVSLHYLQTNSVSHIDWDSWSFFPKAK